MKKLFWIALCAASLVIGCSKDKKADSTTDDKKGAQSGPKTPQRPEKPKVFTKEKLAQLGKTEVAGFAVSSAFGMPGSTGRTEYVADAANGAGLFVNIDVMMGKCFGCPSMDDSGLKRMGKVSKMMLNKKLKAQPDTKADAGLTDVGSQKLVWTYTWGYAESKNQRGGTSRTSTNTLNLYYSDGSNQIHVVAQPGKKKGFYMARSKEEHTKGHSKDELLTAAQAIMAAYLKAL